MSGAFFIRETEFLSAGGDLKIHSRTIPPPEGNTRDYFTLHYKSHEFEPC